MRMCCGGIYDHLKGGFFRYSVDELWMIPHFEKMLYDNGPMIGILSDAYRVTKNNLFLEKMNQSCKWLIDDTDGIELNINKIDSVLKKIFN